MMKMFPGDTRRWHKVPRSVKVYNCYNMTDRDIDIYLIVKSIFAGIGLIANAVLFVIYLKKDRKLRFNQSMLLLITWDTLFILTTLIENFAKETEFSYGILEFFSRSTFSGSVFTTTIIALERFMILCRNK